MDLRQMEYVLALADEQHFTRAAALCGVSQSGLSAAIRGLEDELGTTLFTRTTRRVELTEAGLALVPHARTMLAHAAAARYAVDDVSRELTGRLRIGTEQCLGVVDVNALLEKAHRRHPLLELHFVQAGSYQLAEGVRTGTLDVAFVAVSDHLGPIERIEFGRQPLVLLVPPGHPLDAGGVLGWEDLEEQDFVDFHKDWAIRGLNDAASASHRVKRRVRCSVNDVHTLLDLVHRGLGIAIVPQHVSAKSQAAGLTTRTMPADTPTWNVSAITSVSSNPSSRQLLELARSEAA